MRSLRHRGQTLLVGEIAATISLIRQFISEPDTFKTIWAEDGWMPMCALSNGHFSCLTEPVNGYWPIVHRLVAEPLSMIPLSLWPFIFPLLGAASIGVLCAVIFNYVTRQTSKFFGLVCGLGVVLTPILGVEFLNVFGNVHWVLLMAAMVLIALSRRANVSSPVLLVFLFVSSLSNPVGFMIPATFLLLVIARLKSAQTIMWPFAVSLVGWFIQVFAIMQFDGTNRVGSSQSMTEKVESWANAIVGVVPGVRIARESPASFLFAPSRFTPALIVALTLGLLVYLILRSRSSEALRRFTVLGIGTQVLTAVLLLILDENPRYTFVLVALNLIWIVGLLGASVQMRMITKTVLVCLLIFAPLSGFKAGSYRTTPSSVSWQDQLRIAEERCAKREQFVEFFFAPDRAYVTEVHCSAL